MITLATGNTLRGKAGTAAVIAYTLFGDRKDSTNNYEPIAQGLLPGSTTILYTVPAATSGLISEISLVNTSVADVTGITFYVNGTAATNQITGTLSIPAGGTATYNSNGWTVYSAAGIALTTIGGAAGGDLTGSYPNPTIIPSVALSGNPTAATQSANNNSTRIATTAYVDTADALKANIASPTFTGDPKAPTPSPGDNDTSIATTAFVTAADTALLTATITNGDTTHAPNGDAVFDALALKADIASPTFTGDPKAPTPTPGDNDTSIATSAFVTGAISTADALVVHKAGAENVTGLKTFDIGAKFGNESAPAYDARTIHWDDVEKSFVAFGDDPTVRPNLGYEQLKRSTNASGGTQTNGKAVYVNGGSGVFSTFALARADALATVQNLGILTTTSVANGAVGLITRLGLVHNMDTSAWAAGTPLYLDATTAGTLTSTAPSSPNLAIRVGVVVVQNAVTGILDVDIEPVASSSSAVATFTTNGLLLAREKIELNSLDGRTNTGTTPRVFRPGDYQQSGNYDPTGATDSTPSFSAMMTAIRAHNDRFIIQLTPGVFKIDHDILRNFGTNNPAGGIIGPGRGCCILLPNSAPTGDQAMMAFNRGTTGSDAFTIRGLTIYNTGSVFTAGSAILTNGADGIDISELAVINYYRDVQVSGEPHTMTTNGTVNLTGISPAISAADNGQTVTGPGIPAGATITFVTGSTGTLSAAATNSTTDKRYLNNSIKVSIQKMVSFNTNPGAANTSVGIYVNNGQAGDTYIGPDVVMSDGGNATRRRANVEIAESGHYEITQCNLTGSQTGILYSPQISQVVGFGFHQQVLCDSNTVNGMNVNAVTGSTIKNIKSTNSWYSGTVNAAAPYNIGAAGVITQGAGTINGFTFTTDRFLNNRTHGFEHTAGTDFRWSDCDVKGNSQIGAGTAHGLFVAANVGDWSINGGKYGGTDSATTGSNQGYGIFVTAGTGNNIKIAPDSLVGNTTGPMSFGATGISNFINGCPGLASPYTRSASSAGIGATETTLGNILLPKNSLRVGSTFRLTVKAQMTGSATQVATFRIRIGATNDAVGAGVTNAQINQCATAAGALNGWMNVEFMVTVTALGAPGSVSGSGGGTREATAFSSTTAARAATAGTQGVTTTADSYLTITAITAAGTGLVNAHNTTIEVVNY